MNVQKEMDALKTQFAEELAKVQAGNKPTGTGRGKKARTE
jgi:hypothetical protein